MTQAQPIRCPQCGRIKAVQSLGEGLYRCGHCRGPLFEANPTYDGPASNDPVRAAISNENSKRKGVRR